MSAEQPELVLSSMHNWRELLPPGTGADQPPVPSECDQLLTCVAPEITGRALGAAAHATRRPCDPGPQPGNARCPIGDTCHRHAEPSHRRRPLREWTAPWPGPDRDCTVPQQNSCPPRQDGIQSNCAGRGTVGHRGACRGRKIRRGSRRIVAPATAPIYAAERDQAALCATLRRHRASHARLTIA